MQILLNQPKFNNVNIIKNKSIDNRQNNITKNHYSEINGVYYPTFTAMKAKAVPTKLERFEGCLLGGAIGDAFGAPLEKLTMQEIKSKFKGNLNYLITEKDGIAEFTDDTQMLLFTIEGLINAVKKYPETSIDYYKTILNSYKNWYITQTKDFSSSKNTTGLMRYEELYKRKEPGLTCLESLGSNKIGTTKNRINNSAGNGGVMRIAPVGLFYCNNAEKSFEVGKNIAALTHGNPNGFLPAGALAYLISLLANGEKLEDAIEKIKRKLDTQAQSELLLYKIKLAQNLAKSSISEKEAIETIGSGWTGDEALAIALYSCLKHPEDYKSVIRTSANHSGDSDTTAAIAGNIAGIIHGKNNIPQKWIKSINMRTLIEKYSLYINLITNPNGIMG